MAQAKRISLKQAAYVALKQRILSGQLTPGTLLSERQLAIELAMSKTPVHAALERLEAEGLVTVAAQQGIMVRSASPQDVGDHFEIREALEPFVVARLAGRLTPDQVRRIEGNLRENRRAIRAGDVDANMRLDAEFHLLLCEFLGNSEIIRVMNQIREKAHAVILQITARRPDRMAVSLEEHEAIVQAIIEGDADLAGERVRVHLRNGLQCIFDRTA